LRFADATIKAAIDFSDNILVDRKITVGIRIFDMATRLLFEEGVHVLLDLALSI